MRTPDSENPLTQPASPPRTTIERKSNAVGSKSVIALGFLTVVDHPQHGLFGGYLVLNRCGRPLEFHCTAPIKPNRAQQILYGPTLEPFLYGEQIGQTLVNKARHEPLIVCTDLEPGLAVREHISAPVLLVLPPSDDASIAAAASSEASNHRAGQTFQRRDGAHRNPPGLIHFHWGQNAVAVAETAQADRATITQRMAELALSWDLAEPFCRIREAIEEAQKGVGSGQ
jgi:hypothetical protein